jgi:D-alanyl-D-alanine endopeptidase (penicillin-binding protein 7)
MNRFTRTSKWKSLLPMLGLACASIACAGQAQAMDTAQPDKLHAVADFRSCAKPMYPHDDLAAGHEGTVTLRFRVEATGTVSESKVAKSSGFPGLDEAARQAIEKCQFTPPLVEGKPVATWTHVQYVWSRS